MHCGIDLGPGWIDSNKLDIALVESGNPHSLHFDYVVFYFLSGCSVMIDAAVQILSLANQLHRANKRVCLYFFDETDGVHSYLQRMGFFDLLDPEIDIEPKIQPLKYRRQNKNLVEIASINPKDGNDSIPSRLADTIVNALGGQQESKRFGNALFTVFGELVDNVEQHSSTALEGYAALQVYQEKTVRVAISDSGKGIMYTIRPYLQAHHPDLKNLSDADVFLEMIKRGISRFGTERGCGLKTSADIALRYNASVNVRMPTSRAFITPQAGMYMVNPEVALDNLPLIWGTHICFDFKLDTIHTI